MQTAKFSIGQLVDAWYIKITGHGHTMEAKDINIVGRIVGVNEMQGGVQYLVLDGNKTYTINQGDIEQVLEESAK